MLGKKNSNVQLKPSYHIFKGVENLKEDIYSFGEGKNSSGEVEKRRILVYFDPDIDGCFAGFLVCRALQQLGKTFSWFINDNRDHGFKIPYNALKNTDIIAVDFKIEREEIKRIVDAGANIISLDHHINEKDFIYYENENGYRGYVINNQYPFEKSSSRYLSGAGVVYESMVEVLGNTFDVQENIAIVGITLLSDIRDIENSNARVYLETLYNHKCKGYIGYLIDNTIGDKDFTFGVPRLDRNFIDYKFSPALNSCIRFNQQDMVVEFLLGLGKIDLEFHKMQKTLVNDAITTVKLVEFSHLNIVILDVDKIEAIHYGSEEFISSFVGLIASRFLDGKSCIAYLIKGNKVIRASFRGYINGLNYLEVLSSILDGVGHEPAFGIKNLKPSRALFKKANELCKNLEMNTKYKKKVISVNNVSVFLNSGKCKRIGEENCFCLSQNRTYLKYKGSNVHTRRGGVGFKEYIVDGISVLCFNDDLKPTEDLILPILERGNLNLYLQTKDD